MRRRDFINLMGGAAAWPLAAQAQRTESLRRIGMLSGLAENDQNIQAEISGLRAELARLGWIEGRNLRIDVRFGSNDPDRIRAHAAELVNLAPEAIVTDSGETTRALQQQTRSIPIVITAAGDPVVNGLVKNIARPEGNITGITNLYGSIGGKWLELLKEAVPQIETVGLVHDPQLEPTVSGNSYLSSIEEAARTLSVRTINMPYGDAVDLVHEIDVFAAVPNGALIILPPLPSTANRQTILRLSTQHRLPTVTATKTFVTEGCLIGYTSTLLDRLQRVASFVDRLLGGAKVSELPLEYPTKFELLINLKTAKALGLAIPEAFLARADELIE
jgi:putative ABC transport system substrate-binding protein